MVATHESRTVTFDEFCKETGFKPTTTRRMIAVGILPHIRLGRRVRIARDVLEAALQGEYNTKSLRDNDRAA